MESRASLDERGKPIHGGDSMKVYVIGSLRNPEIPKIANKIRETGYEVFDDWFGAGPEADDKWRDYEKERGRSYVQALEGYAAKHVFAFDKRHLEESDAVVLCLPAGKSGHLELGWALGKGKRGYILLDNPDRWDVMYQFADMVTDNLDKIMEDIIKESYGRRKESYVGRVLSANGGSDSVPVEGPQYSYRGSAG